MISKHQCTYCDGYFEIDSEITYLVEPGCEYSSGKWICVSCADGFLESQLHAESTEKMLDDLARCLVETYSNQERFQWLSYFFDRMKAYQKEQDEPL